MPMSLLWRFPEKGKKFEIYTLIEHRRLTFNRSKDRIFRLRTSAMAADLVDHRWMFFELLAYPAFCQLYGDITDNLDFSEKSSGYADFLRFFNE